MTSSEGGFRHGRQRTAREALKRAVERAIQRLAARPRRMAGRTLILAYHNVVPDNLANMGDRSLHLRLSDFLSQVELLETHCRVRGLAQALTAQSGHDRPTVAITFDDAYAGAVELAVPELAKRGLPCTVFVAPGLVGHRSFWWDELAQLHGGLPAAVRATAIDRYAGRPSPLLGGPAHAPPEVGLPSGYGCATVEQIFQIGSCHGVTFGAHSWSHPNLVQLDDEELIEELDKPLRWLARAPIATLPMVAYPYGLTSDRVAKAVREAGYTAAFRIEGGWHRSPAEDPWSIPRYNVPSGISIEGFLIRLSGFLSK